MSRGEDDKEVTAELRDKVKSKMDVAKFFSGFISIFLGLSFKELIVFTNSKFTLEYAASWVGIALVLTSLGFSIATMLSLDRLLMPPELWKKPPTGPTNKAIKNEMVKAWLRLFYTAVICFLGGVIAFLIALTKQIILPLAIFTVVVLIPYAVFKSLRIGRKIHG